MAFRLAVRGGAVLMHHPFYNLFRKLEDRRRRKWERVPAPLRRLFWRERTFEQYVAKFREAPKERKSGK